MTMANQWFYKQSEKLKSESLATIIWSKFFVSYFYLLMFFLNSRYLPIGGLKEFCNLSVELAYGADAAPVKDSRVASIQALSGTGKKSLF